VTEEIESQPAERPVDRQLQKAVFPQAVVVLDRVRGVAVVIGRPRGEVGCQVQAFLLQASLLFGDPKSTGQPSLRRSA
jgi:hypothetical protein